MTCGGLLFHAPDGQPKHDGQFEACDIEQSVGGRHPLKPLLLKGGSVMKREIQSMLAAVTLALASPVLMAEENSGNDSGPSPQAGYGPGYGMGPGMMYGPGYGHGYGMGPGMMYGPGYGPGYGMGPGMMHRPGYGPGYGMGPGMMYGPGYGQEPDSVDDTNRPYWGPGMMYGPNYGGRR
jgi:hypothetical protein